MSNYYEETMPLETNNDDYLKYYFEDSLPLFQKLNIIIKKGEPFQKQALLSKLSILQTSELFKSLMQYILNEIETWDKETITSFPKYLYPLLAKPKDILIKSIDNELFNNILKKIIAIISSTEEQISKEYMKYIEKIILYYHKENIVFPFEIKEEIFDDIISLGKFGESILNQQLSICLCCSFIRLINNTNDENVQKLFNRVCFLSSYCDKQIETQLSHELEFLFPILKQNLIENSDINKAVNFYINRDTDFVLQTTTIISIIKNLQFICYGDFVDKLVDKIREIFGDEINFEQSNKIKIFLELIKNLQKNYKKIDKNIIKKLFEDNFISKFILNNKTENIIIENFDTIYFIYEHILSDPEIINADNSIDIKLNYDEIFFDIYNHYLNINFTNNYYTHRKKIYTEAENILRRILYINLMKIIPNLSDFKKCKNLYDKISYLFNNDNILFALDCYSENFEIYEKNDSKEKKNNNTLYNLMYFCLKKNSENCKANCPYIKAPNLKSISPTKKDSLNNTNHESYYIKLFNNILNNIFYAFNEYPESFNNNMHLLLCDLFQKIIKKIYKYLKPHTKDSSNSISNSLFLNTGNKFKIKSIDKIYDDIYLNYLIKLVDKNNLGYYIRAQLIKIFPSLILYSKNRYTYFKYIQDHIIQSKTYFNRRYAVVYLNKCFQTFSFKMFNKIGLVDFLISLIYDENNAISANIINLIYLYNKKISKNTIIMFQNICRNLSKINKDNRLVHIEDFDIEKNRNINNILNLDLTREDNNNNKEYGDNKENEYWINLENKLMRKEKEIFGDDINYGFHHIKNLVRSQTLNLNSQSLDIKSMKRKNSYLNNIINNNNKEIVLIKGKDKFKKGLTKDKYSTSTVINAYNNIPLNYSLKESFNSKTYLPKIKQNRNSNLSTKIITRPNIKKLNNFKIKQENQKFYEISSKNNSSNNSMIISSEKSLMKTTYDNLPFSKKGKSEAKAIKIPNSMPSFYPELLNNNNEIKIKLERKDKDMLINTIYKTKGNIAFHLEYNNKINKYTKLKKDSIKENMRYNRMIYKLNGEFDKFNLTNISLKEKGGQIKWHIK